MCARRTHELTAKGNPHGIAVKQHIRSKACIKRFTTGGRVGVLERSRSAPYEIGPGAACFCAMRAWDQRLEHSKWIREIETRYQAAVRRIDVAPTERDHAAVTAYFALWEVRATLADASPQDVELPLAHGRALTTEEEDLADLHHLVLIRPGSQPDRSIMSGRTLASLHAMRDHADLVERLSDVGWGLIRSSGGGRFLSADIPGTSSSSRSLPDWRWPAGNRSRPSTPWLWTD